MPIKTILLVEDNEFQRDQISDALREEGYAVTQAENGRVALGLVVQALREGLDLIISDYRMPHLNGDEWLIEALKRNPGLTAVSIFLCSYEDPDTLGAVLARLRQLGLQVEFVPKYLADLQAALWRVFEGRES